MAISWQEIPKTGRKEVFSADFRKICSSAGIYCDTCKRMFAKKENLSFYVSKVLRSGRAGYS
jgi:methylphosphotriester-DNA--protein-cysteine methyltransferase